MLNKYMMNVNNPNSQHNMSNISGRDGFQSVFEEEEGDVMLFPEIE